MLEIIELSALSDLLGDAAILSREDEVTTWRSMVRPERNGRGSLTTEYGFSRLFGPRPGPEVYEFNAGST